MSGMIGASSSNFYALEANPFSQSPQAYPFLRLSGSKGGWGGIDFFDYSKALLVRADFQGIFDYLNATWKWRFNNSGVLDVGSVPWASINDNPISYPPSANPSGVPYGSVEIDGINNGYAGIKFTDVNAHLMFSNAIQGAYRNNPTTFLNEWLWYFNGGVLTVGSVPWARLTGIPLASDSQAGLVSEESAGIWTPILRGNATAGTVTYGGRYGTYTKIGDEIKARFTIVNATYSGIPLGENLVVDGLPFSCSSGSGYNGSLILNYYSGISLINSSYTQLGGRVANGSSRLEFMRSGSGVSGGNLIVNGLTSGSNVIEGTIVYSAG